MDVTGVVEFFFVFFGLVVDTALTALLLLEVLLEDTLLVLGTRTAGDTVLLGEGDEDAHEERAGDVDRPLLELVPLLPPLVESRGWAFFLAFGFVIASSTLLLADFVFLSLMLFGEAVVFLPLLLLSFSADLTGLFELFFLGLPDTEFTVLLLVAVLPLDEFLVLGTRTDDETLLLQLGDCDERAGEDGRLLLLPPLWLLVPPASRGRGFFLGFAVASSTTLELDGLLFLSLMHLGVDCFLLLSFSTDFTGLLELFFLGLPEEALVEVLLLLLLFVLLDEPLELLGPRTGDTALMARLGDCDELHDERAGEDGRPLLLPLPLELLCWCW